MDTSAFPVAELRQPTLASQLMIAITSLIGSPAITAHALDTAVAQPAPVIDFALTGLPRRVVHRGFGDVRFNEHAAPTERGGCDGTLVAVLRFAEHHAVIDADCGHAEFDDDNDAYLIGVAHVLQDAQQARALAAQCVQKRRQRACGEALRRAIELALPLPAHVVAKVVRDAMSSAVAAERMPWLCAVRYFLDRHDLEVMR